MAQSNNEDTWADYDTALDAAGNYDGIGFFFKSPYFGIDIDDVRPDIDRYKNDDHENNIVSEFIDLMGSYSEVSTSGNGIHIIAKGELPTNGSRKGNVEMYNKGRFFIMTGDKLGDYNHIVDDSDLGKVNYLHNKYITSSEVSTVRDSRMDGDRGTTLAKDKVIRIASNSKNGIRFKLFMGGGWEQFYNSQSEADMAFANDLAFWTNRDFNMMDDIFRGSALYRDKYDEKRGDSTYGADTLNKAITECTNAFNPQQSDEEFNLYVMENDVKEVKNKSYSYDDTGNAGRFSDKFGDSLRYSYNRKNWYVYSGTVWELDGRGKVKAMVDSLLELMKKEPVVKSGDIDEEDAQKNLQKHLKYSRGSNGKANMLKESEHVLAIGSEEFDQDQHYLNVKNGYIDLKTATLHDHDRNKYFTKKANTEFTDKIDYPLWQGFLNQIFDHDQELINYIKRAIGYSLCGSVEEQMLFILHGNGRNGKSVFLDIITEMLGNYTVNIQPQTIMVKPQSGGANSDVARLQGARFVTSTEPNDGMRFDEGLVKQLTGGDRVTARFLYGDEFDFNPEFKLWIATNHKPIIRGTDDGIWRRLAIIPFTVQIPLNEVDKNLTYKLRKEMTSILSWAVEGYREWQRYGLAEPGVIKDQRQKYRTEMDATELFIDECCVRMPDEREKASDLYQIYRSWASDNGQYMMSSTKFGTEMGNKFRRVKNSVYYYEGIRVKTDYNDGKIRLNM